METKDWVIVGGIALSFFTTIYALGVKWVTAWERIEREKDKDRIEGIVKIHVRELVDEIKENYAEMIQLLKTGTFK